MWILLLDHTKTTYQGNLWMDVGVHNLITFCWTLIYPTTWTVSFLRSQEETKLLEWRGNRLKNICLGDLCLKVKEFYRASLQFRWKVVKLWRGQIYNLHSGTEVGTRGHNHSEHHREPKIVKLRSRSRSGPSRVSGQVQKVKDPKSWTWAIH